MVRSLIHFCPDKSLYLNAARAGSAVKMKRLFVCHLNLHDCVPIYNECCDLRDRRIRAFTEDIYRSYST